MSLIDDEDGLRSDSEPVGVARRPTDSDAGDRLDGVARLRAQQRKEVCIAPRPPRTCAVTHSHWPDPPFSPLICMRLHSNRMFTTKTRRLTSALAKYPFLERSPAWYTSCRCVLRPSPLQQPPPWPITPHGIKIAHCWLARGRNVTTLCGSTCRSFADSGHDVVLVRRASTWMPSCALHVTLRMCACVHV
jgi:hypothetical protein